MDAQSKVKNQFSNVICKTGEIKGKVKFGIGCILNPGANIVVDEGFTLTFGDFNIIEEKCQIKVRANKDLPKDQQKKDFFIGNNNIFEVDTKIYSPNIGNNNYFQHKSYIEQGVTISDNCNIGVCVKLQSGTNLDKNTRIIFPLIQTIDQNFDENQFVERIKEVFITQAELIKKQNPIE